MPIENDIGEREQSPPRDSADAAGLRYVSDVEPGIRRRKTGKGFSYRGPGGEPLNDPETLKRIKSLAVPPAWTEVWICPDALGHLQATGRDARRRKQYRYNPVFREIRETTKYDRLIPFAQALPRIRANVSKHLELPGVPREKVIATIVNLLETTLIRVGNRDYARANKSHGLTTLSNPHVRVNGAELRFHFRGKGGKTWRLQVRDRRVAKVVRACQELPGQHLFEYRASDGNIHNVTSSDVNAYLREVSGLDITAKDFRTWTGTVQAALALEAFGAPSTGAEAKRNLKLAIAEVAGRLGNTVAICRKCYVHPHIVECYMNGRLVLESGTRDGVGDEKGLLRAEEQAVLSLLERTSAVFVEQHRRAS